MLVLWGFACIAALGWSLALGASLVALSMMAILTFPLGYLLEALATWLLFFGLFDSDGAPLSPDRARIFEAAVTVGSWVLFVALGYWQWFVAVP